VAFNKTVFAVLLSASMTVAVCAADKKVNDEEQRTIGLARLNFEYAKAMFEKKYIQCVEIKQPILAPSLFKAVDLSGEEMGVALVVLSQKAEDACMGGAKSELAVAASVYRTTAKHFGQEAESASRYTEDLMFGHYWRLLQFEVRYLAINSKQRMILESIPELRKPTKHPPPPPPPRPQIPARTPIQTKLSGSQKSLLGCAVGFPDRIGHIGMKSNPR
jgi:hypothetical protein